MSPRPAPGDSGVFHRYVGLPFETMVLQGAPSKQIALAAATGATLGLFPVVGITIPMCFVAAHVLGVPQTITHVVNYAVFPVQIPMMLAFARLGETIFGAPRLSFAPAEIWNLATTDFPLFVDRYGRELGYAAVGWLAVAPFVFGAAYALVLYVVQRFRDDAALAARPS
jgi:hypothetical protein